MRQSLIVLFGLAAGTAAVLIPAGLGRSERAAAAGAAAARDITMVVWGMPFEDLLFRDRYARGFEDTLPGVRVEYQRHSDYWSKYNAWHAKGEGAEVMRVGIDAYFQFVERGMLEPLNAYIGYPPYGLSDEQLGKLPGAVLDTLTIDGKIYALPEDNAQYGLFYNKAIFDAHNARHPDDPVAYPDADWTWRDLRAAARKLTRRNARGEVEIQGFDLTVWAWPFFNFFLQAGGRAWTDDGLTTLVNADAGVEALEFLGTLVRDGSWRPYFGKDQATGPQPKFVSGRTAMLMGGSWLVPKCELDNPDLDFAVSPPPRHRERAVVSGSVLWCMSVHADHKHEGWRMIRWLLEDEQAAAYWDTLRVAPPANSGVINSPAFESTSGIPKFDAEGRAIPGRFEVPPMPADRFADRAEWLRYAWTPDPETGRAPGVVLTGRYQEKLQTEIGAVLQAYLSDVDRADPRALLDQAARNVHEQIDRDRAAKGLGPVAR